MRFAAWAATLLLAATGAAAQDTPGDFDFYVLSLSWSPSYCETAHRPDPEQCEGAARGFVVHGLWPQYERGYPDYCVDTPRLPRSILATVADLMPAGLAQYQWQKHGTCSGLRPERYFDLLRRAYEAIDIPDIYEPLTMDAETSPAAIEQGFIAANPGLSERGIAVTCSRDGAIEVRICLTQRLGFRRCTEVDSGACRARTITLPGME
ncbi:MAG: ribonuclease T [Bauldia sp.]|nr:ribonuclease T [Bauldia sp.]